MMFLAVVDAHSKWMDVFPMKSTTSTSTIDRLRYSFAVHGLPKVVVTDNGPQWVSGEMEQWLKRNGIRHLTSPAYHPASNGLAERAIQTVKAALKKTDGSVSARVERFLFKYRNTPHSTTGETPAALLANHVPRTHLDLLSPRNLLCDRVQEKQQQMQRREVNVKERRYSPGDDVFVRLKGKGSPWIPAVKLCMEGQEARLKLLEGNRKVVLRHIEDTKQRFIPDGDDDLDIVGASSLAVAPAASQVVDDAALVVDNAAPAASQVVDDATRVVDNAAPAALQVVDNAAPAAPQVVDGTVPGTLRRSGRDRRAPKILDL
jgi:hypothetical protein